MNTSRRRLIRPSVASGGIYRELVTRTVGVPAAVPAEPATPPAKAP